MAVNVTVNGVQYVIPQQGDNYTWGSGQGGTPGLTALLQSLAANTLQPTGGSFPLTAEANFGTGYGAVLPYVSLGTNTRQPLSATGTALLQANGSGKLQASENGGKAKSLFPAFAPEDYGAVGDGATDDTVALNNMFAAVVAAASGGKNPSVRFANKTYRYTAQLKIDPASPVQVTVQGAGGYFGFGGTVLRYDGATSLGTTTPALHLAGMCNSYWSDICFDGNDKTEVLVQFDSQNLAATTLVSEGNVVERCSFVNVKHATTGSVGLRWGAFSTEASYGADVSENTVRNCHFSMEQNAFTTAAMQATCISIGISNVLNYRVENCTLGAAAVGVTCSNGSFNNIIGCNFEDLLTVVQPSVGGCTKILGGYAETQNVSGTRIASGGDNGGNPGTLVLEGLTASIDVNQTDNKIIDWNSALVLKGCAFQNYRNSDHTLHPFYIRAGSTVVSESNHFTGCTVSPFVDQTGVFIGSDNGYRRALNQRVWQRGDFVGPIGSYSAVPDTQGIPLESTALKAWQLPSGTGVTVNYDGRVQHGWCSVTFTYQAFTGLTGASNQILLQWLKQNTNLARAAVTVDTPFAGTGVTAVTVQVEKTVGGQEYVAQGSAMAAAGTVYGQTDATKGHILKPGDAAYNSTGDFNPNAANNNMYLTLSTTGANLSALTAGQLTVRFKTEYVP